MKSWMTYSHKSKEEELMLTQANLSLLDLRLWHQLSIALEKFLSNSGNIAGDNFFDVLFSKFSLS
jgi:hypothetical protein